MGVSSMTGFARAEGEARHLLGLGDEERQRPVARSAAAPGARFRCAGAAAARRAGAALPPRQFFGNLAVTRTAPPAVRVNRESLAQLVALMNELAGADRGGAAAPRRLAGVARRRRDGRGRTGAGRSRARRAPSSTAGRWRSTGWPPPAPRRAPGSPRCCAAQLARDARAGRGGGGLRRGPAGGDPREAGNAAGRARRARPGHAGRAGRAGNGVARHPRRYPRGARPAARPYRAGRRAAAAAARRSGGSSISCARS